MCATLGQVDENKMTEKGGIQARQPKKFLVLMVNSNAPDFDRQNLGIDFSAVDGKSAASDWMRI